MLTESIEVVPVGTQGCHALDVRNSERLWRYYHERYCMTLVAAGQAEWRYRSRSAEASTRGVMLMEPGEVHVNTSVEAAGSFFAVCIDPDHIAQLTQDYGLGNLHFNTEFLRAEPCIQQLQRLRFACEHEEPAAQEEQLCLALHQILKYASERSLVRPGLAGTPVRRGAKLLENRYRSERWRTVDVRKVAEEVGMSYHWFVHSFKSEFGLAPYQFVQALRRESAKALIAAGPSDRLETMRDIAMEAGYADASHMTREFRREYGLTPGEMAAVMHHRWSPRFKRALEPALP